MTQATGHILIRRHARDGQDGQDGNPGKDGMTPVAVGGQPWSSSRQYVGSSIKVEIVKYLNLYYVTKPDAGNIPVGTPPTNAKYWNPFGAQYESVATELLFAKVTYLEKAIVRMLKTADSGRRIETSGNDLLMFDSQNNQKMRITGEDIDIGFPTAQYTSNKQSIGGSYSQQGGYGSDSGEMSVFDFVVPANNTEVQIPPITIDASVQQSYYGGSIDDQDCYLAIYKDGKHYQTLCEDSFVSYGSLSYAGGTVTLPAGQYRIEFGARWQWSVDREDPYWNTISISFTDSNTGVLVVKSSSLQATNIGANGIAIHLGGSFSAVFATDNGTPKILLQGIGSNNRILGLSIDASGVKINRGDGQGWKAL